MQGQGINARYLRRWSKPSSSKGFQGKNTIKERKENTPPFKAGGGLITCHWRGNSPGDDRGLGD